MSDWSSDVCSSDLRLFEDHQFYTPTKNAIIHSPDAEMPSEQPDTGFPFILTTGRVRDQWHTMTKTGKVSKLKQHIREPQLEIHKDDAGRLGIEEGQLVEITSRRGNVRVKATIDRKSVV